jgi:ribose-phosphate pyrophosphokinase
MIEKDRPMIFAAPGTEGFARSLIGSLGAEDGKADIRSFPDGETYIRVLSNVDGRLVVIVCSLFRPDEKLVPLYFLARSLREFGARHICLAAPYLSYMRQDKMFQPGEAITSEYFANLICSFADSIITVDAHLHRRDSLSEIYDIPGENLHAAVKIAEWISQNVRLPVLIGPDSESEQWVSEVASNARAPFTVLDKTRRGDHDVSVSVPNLENYRDRTPVLVDDIISTARTMIETVGHLRTLGMKTPICIGVHAVFAGDAYRELIGAGVERVVTCNTVPHETNRIDLSDLFVDFIKGQADTLRKNQNTCGSSTGA